MDHSDGSSEHRTRPEAEEEEASRSQGLLLALSQAAPIVQRACTGETNTRG